MCIEGLLFYSVDDVSVYRRLACGLVMPASPALAALFPQISRQPPNHHHHHHHHNLHYLNIIIFTSKIATISTFIIIV